MTLRVQLAFQQSFLRCADARRSANRSTGFLRGGVYALVLVQLTNCGGETSANEPTVPPENVSTGGSVHTGGNSSVQQPSPQGGAAPLIPNAPCNAPPPSQASFNTLTGFSGSEDFAFDADGNLVSNRDGRITKQQKDGTESVFIGRLGAGELSGMAYLPDGRLVVASVDEGVVYLIGEDGSTSPLLTGLTYPNGVAVDLRGKAFVSDHDEGVVIEIDPNTKRAHVIASGIESPNGLAFSPGYQSLYVCGFGSGTIHEIPRAGDGVWGTPRVFYRGEGAEWDEDPNTFGESAGLDGLAVDACGFVYVTEFSAGIVWRIAPDGTSIKRLFRADSTWIPNLHWGSGVGGWDEGKLYVMDRDEGKVFEVDVGIHGVESPYP